MLCFCSGFLFFFFFFPPCNAHIALFFCEIRQSEDTEGKVMEVRAAVSAQGSCPRSFGHGVSSLTDDFILVIESSAGPPELHCWAWP